jgi:hypothetical protein
MGLWDGERLEKHLDDARRGLAEASRRGDLIASGRGAYALMDAIWEIGTAPPLVVEDTVAARTAEFVVGVRS